MEPLSFQHLTTSSHNPGFQNIRSPLIQRETPDLECIIETIRHTQIRIHTGITPHPECQHYQTVIRTLSRRQILSTRRKRRHEAMRTRRRLHSSTRMCWTTRQGTTIGTHAYWRRQHHSERTCYRRWYISLTQYLNSSGTYVSPSDAIMSPASQKLSSFKQRQINKQYVSKAFLVNPARILY